jgi:phage antirepressor YoqD-like protein
MTETTLESCLNNPDFAIGLLTALKEEREKSNALATKVTEQHHQIEEMKPKVTYYDVILNCKDAVPITNISKDYGMSAKTMNIKLHELGVQYKQGEMWLLYQKYANQGYTQSKTFATEKDRSHMHTYWTQKGRVFIYELLKEHGIVPTIERNEAN